VADDPKPKSPKPDFENVGLTPLAQKHYEEYVRYLKRCDEEITATPLIVLVWGPVRLVQIYFKNGSR
jgi:hypothetical protein